MTQTSLARRGTAERNVRDAHRFLDLLAAHDLDGAVDMFTDDAELQAPFSPAGLPTGAVGRDTIGVLFRQIFDNYGRVEFRDRRIAATTDPDVVAARWTVDIDVVSTGNVYASEVVAFFELRHGRITHFTEYFNPEKVRAALGLP